MNIITKPNYLKNQYLGKDVYNRLIFYFSGDCHTMKSSYGEMMG